MNNVFIVAPEGNDARKPYQCTLYRLEVRRQDVIFADDSKLSKDACLVVLQEKLDVLTCCEVVGVEFPFFAKEEIEQGERNYRPCIALYGGPVCVPALYLAMFMGTPRFQTGDFEIHLTAPDALQPMSTRNAIVDCSKLCSFPETYTRPDTRLYGQPTWDYFYADPIGTRSSLSNRLRATNAQHLREKNVSKLVELLLGDPHFDYVDTTLQYDIGSMVQCAKQREDGNWIEYNKV